MSILLLGGSPSTPSSSSRLLHHIGERLAAQGYRYTRLQVRDLLAKALLHAERADAGIARALEAVALADAIVIATPVYKASYTGILKAFLDLLPQDGLAGKVVLPVATGGSQSHMLALDYALRPVLHALAAKQVLGGIFATSQQLQWHEDSGLTMAVPIAARVAAGVQELQEALSPSPRRQTAAPPLPTRSLQDHPYAPVIQAA
ncbi:MAG: NADPH-dependent FMN reductase [Pseudomonadota bacterium]